MQRPPPVREFILYPIVSGTIALAVGVTLASWSHNVDISPLYETVDIRRGQLWRLLTSALPHGDIMHLVFNVYWIWVFGALIERIFGHARTLGIFVLLAVAANGVEYALLDGGIGLSGIGYGLFGFLWVLSRRQARFADAVDKNTISLFVLWFFVCIILTIGGSPVANVAHGVGAIAGALLGWADSETSRERLLAAAALTILVAAVLAGSTVARPWINLSKDGGKAEGQLGYDALVADRDDEALHWLRDATHMQPRMAEYWFNMGIAYDGLKRHPEARAAYGRAAALEPSNADYKAAAHDGDVTP